VSENDYDGRYLIFGYIAEEQDDINPDFPGAGESDFRLTKSQVIYDTDDRWEARRLVNIEGGFIRDGKWHVAVGALDTETNGILGYVPPETDDA
jgi:hypothetical protein